MKRNEAKELIDALISLREGATDQVASLSTIAYPTLKEDGSLISSGTRINYNGKLLRASADLWDTAENNPENAPTLWEEILYREGIRIIPETITVGTAFAKDEQGWWNDEIYTSLIDANVYTPDAFPSGWEKAN